VIEAGGELSDRPPARPFPGAGDPLFAAASDQLRSIYASLAPCASERVRIEEEDTPRRG
jgi:hypothetical protein